MFKSKLYLVPVILGVLALVAGACAQPAPTPTPTLTGILKVYVTDAPHREEVTSIMVTVAEVQVHKAFAEQQQEQSASDNQTHEQEREREQQQTQQSEGEWITIGINENTTTFDLLKVRGIERFLGTSEVEATKYTQVRLVIDTIQVKLGDGELQDATLPSKELKIVHPFDVIAGETTAMVLDFDADRMVTVTGGDKIIVKPVIKLKVRQEKPTGEQDDKIQEEAALEDMIWVLQSYGEPGNLKATLEGTEITATFESTEGRVRGSAGCNTYSGDYHISDSKLSIPLIVSTEIGCLEPEGIMEQELQYLKALQAAESYQIRDGKLEINCGAQILVFAAHEG
jgi:heat shock protein HslJ